MCDIPIEQLQIADRPVIFSATYRRISTDSRHFASEVQQKEKSADITLVI
jgi:hypothetical protein